MSSKAKPAGTKIAAGVAAEVHEFCRVHADAAVVKKYARYFVEGYDAYGVDFRIPEYDAQRKAWLGRLKEAGSDAVFEAGDRLMKTGKYEEGFCAIRFAADSREYYTPEVFERIAGWFESGIGNWALCDVLCGEVLSQFLLDQIVELKALQPWVESEHKYQRRAVPVTLIKTLKSRRDYGPLFTLIEPLMSDREKVVQQGTGWFLREAWRLQPKPAEAFLMWFKQTCPRLIVQYATEKMDKEARAKFRRTR